MQGVRKLYDGARNVVKNVASAAVNGISSVVNTVADIGSSICSGVASFFGFLAFTIA